MMRYEIILEKLRKTPKNWLITGVAGFIGSNLLETLLKLDQTIVGLDNFSTGHQHNLDQVKLMVSKEQWNRFSFVEGDITDYSVCTSVMESVDYVLHQAALGSVPRSINDPLSSNAANVTGFLNILHAAKEERVESFTYAASSSTYGDHEALPKVESTVGQPLSPYAVTKLINEIYASVYARVYEFPAIGLRYFNVFGPRQDPDGPYAAVIPKWISAMIDGEDITINGDGETSRDFCFIHNTIQMNILAATAPERFKNEVYNVALGDRTSLNDLATIIKAGLNSRDIYSECEIRYGAFREGDVRHSEADMTKAKQYLDYEPKFRLSQGIEKTLDWYLS